MLRYARTMDSNHESSSSFWRNNGRAVPGRPSPKKDQKAAAHTAKVGKGQLGSFQDYQQSVSDAWDLGDDEFCIITGIAGEYLPRGRPLSALEISKKVQCQRRFFS